MVNIARETPLEKTNLSRLGVEPVLLVPLSAGPHLDCTCAGPACVATNAELTLGPKWDLFTKSSPLGSGPYVKERAERWEEHGEMDDSKGMVPLRDNRTDPLTWF